MLGRRALSAGEVAQRLTRKGFPPQEVEAEVERLRRAGLVDDLEVARATCRAQLRKGIGRRRMSPLLARRLVDADTVSAALAEVTAPMEEAALGHALSQAARRHPRFRELPAERQKVIRYLLTRGFAPFEVRRAIAGLAKEGADAAEAFDLEDP
jgi:regulatory protein